MAFHFDLWAAVIYAVFFLGLIFKAEKFQWFWAAVIAWLGVGFWGAEIIPGAWGITHVGPLFIPHFYLTIGSIFFFLNHWQKTPDGQFWQADEAHPLLSLFAVSNALMTAVFILLAGMVWYHYPEGTSIFSMPALLAFYALEPSYWFIVQLVLMAVFYVHRVKIMKQPASLFSSRQLQSGFLMLLVVQVAVVLSIIIVGRF
ncbi:hypothetical protein GJV52_09295 [Neisseria brasiliensis]|uniref:hypothetical protein n=1 Tax=Neisseria TaxID=482 RepID=UPI000C27C59F|nr:MULTISPECIES: hypothetical protein [Neisseria]PJO78293.1 hypothetical protein CWC45_05655 [Neisseria sp. N177_16]QGL25714.1 hypothetical protein GJV52_09295 [Neisseria brasiliensis]